MVEPPVRGEQVHDRRRLVAHDVEHRRPGRHPARVEPHRGDAKRCQPQHDGSAGDRPQHGPEVAPAVGEPAVGCRCDHHRLDHRPPPAPLRHRASAPPTAQPLAAGRTHGVAPTVPPTRWWTPAAPALSFSSCHSGEWRNWQTRWLQVPVSVRTWGFKSPLAHDEWFALYGLKRSPLRACRPDPCGLGSVPVAGSHDAAVSRPSCQLVTARQLELAQYGGRVALDRLDRHLEPAGDLLVRVPAGEQP